MKGTEWYMLKRLQEGIGKYAIPQRHINVVITAYMYAVDFVQAGIPEEEVWDCFCSDIRQGIDCNGDRLVTMAHLFGISVYDVTGTPLNDSWIAAELRRRFS